MTYPEPHHHAPAPQAAEPRIKFVDVHVLRSVPFANLNRDDLGQPKSMVFGGKNRARVSSQCIKRAVRVDMDTEAAIRTRRLPEQAAKIVSGRTGLDEVQSLWAVTAMLAAASKQDGFLPYGGKLGSSHILTFLPAVAAERIAEIVAASGAVKQAVADNSALIAKADQADGNAREKAMKAAVNKLSESVSANDKDAAKQVAEILGSVNPMIALMGRMLTDLPDTNVDGAAQVAHAFTTHAAVTENDYFTAVDDLNPAEDTGAGFLGSNDYTSGVFYQYACIDLDQFRENLSEVSAPDYAETVAAFVESFAEAGSGAKRTTTAPHTRPSLVMAVARSNRPVNYANAFEQAVTAGKEAGGYIVPSVKRLLEEASDDGDAGVVRACCYTAAHASDDGSAAEWAARTGRSEIPAQVRAWLAAY